MLGVVIQIDAREPVTGAAVPLRAASHDHPDVCHLTDAVAWPVIAKLPRLGYDLFDGAFEGRIATPGASMTIAIEPWPAFARLAIADTRFRLWTGEVGAPFAAWTQRVDARVTQQPVVGDGRAELTFAVDDRWLDRALLATYAGTSGAEGPAASKGQAKPLALGAPRYVPGVLVDPVNSLFQVSGHGAIVAIDAALERLARFGAPVRDYASVAELLAATIPAGRWATALSGGWARFGAPPTGQVCFLVRGDRAGPDGWSRRPGQQIRRLALLAGGAGRVADASLDALDAARPYDLSLYLDQQTTARELIQEVAASVNAVAGVSWMGRLFVQPVAIGAPSLTLAADGPALPPVARVRQLEIAPPFGKLAITAERTWAVHALADVAFTAPLVDLGSYSDAATYREGNIVTAADGSRWLYTATTPTAGAAPFAGSTRWSAYAAAPTVAWSAVSDPTGTKPADNATNSADPQSAFGPNRTVAQTLATLEAVAPLPAATALLKGAAADRAAAERQIQRALDLLAAAILRVTGEAGRTREVLRDAGIVADPTTGTVRIYALDLLAERTSARLAEVGLTLDAVKGALISKVERTEFRDFTTDVGAVQQMLSAAGGTSGLAVAARQARFAGGAGAEAGLRALLAGDAASRRQLVQIAEVRQEVFAKIVDAQTAEAAARTLLNVQIGAVDARVAAETLARIAAGEAFARDIRALGVTDGQLAATISRADEARVAGDKANADTIEQLRAAVGTVSGSVSEVRKVVVGASGAAVRAMTVLDANGRISGVAQTNDGTIASFGVTADRFGVYHPDTGALLFYVDKDGAIAASFKQQAIGASNLKTGAAQGCAYFTTDADMVIPRGWTGQLINMTFQKVEASSDMELLFYAHFVAEDDIQVDCRFILDGVVRHVEPANLILIDSNAELTITPFRFFRGLAAGQHAISIEIYNREADNRKITVTAGATLKCTELRQASVGSATGSMGQVVAGAGTGGGDGSGSGGSGTTPRNQQ
jgi:hypothetical protein